MGRPINRGAAGGDKHRRRRPTLAASWTSVETHKAQQTAIAALKRGQVAFDVYERSTPKDSACRRTNKLFQQFEAPVLRLPKFRLKIEIAHGAFLFFVLLQ